MYFQFLEGWRILELLIINLQRILTNKFIMSYLNPTEHKRVSSNSNHLFFKKKKLFVKTSISEILFIKADGDYTMVYTANDTFLSSCSLRKFEVMLKANGFLKVHRSYLANLNALTSLDLANGFIYYPEHNIPISRSVRKILLEKLSLI